MLLQGFHTQQGALQSLGGVNQEPQEAFPPSLQQCPFRWQETASP